MESEPTKPTKATRKTTTQGTKAGATSEADTETEAEPSQPTKGDLQRGTRTRSQSVGCTCICTPATTKRSGTPATGATSTESSATAFRCYQSLIVIMLLPTALAKVPLFLSSPSDSVPPSHTLSNLFLQKNPMSYPLIRHCHHHRLPVDLQDGWARLKHKSRLRNPRSKGKGMPAVRDT
ncbi:hypothetical protein BGY98DRAFT_252966 [Russula aff. rugulosa BPL654]|nr:hypothetical protein BGY98DRAFT_252966 [Russula aff. rugulosa BPL654]